MTCWCEERGHAHPCTACGYEPAPVHFDPALEAMLRAEVKETPQSRRMAPLGHEHEIRYMLAGVERSLAEMRSIA